MQGQITAWRLKCDRRELRRVINDVLFKQALDLWNDFRNLVLYKSQLTQYGWQPRISEQRNYPNITEHVDFIRAYIELHSTLDTITIRQRDKERKSPRLRIYGNRHFLDDLTKMLSSQVEITPKRVQMATRLSDSSGILYYQSRRELEKLLAYLYAPDLPYFHKEYYNHYRSML